MRISQRYLINTAVRHLEQNQEALDHKRTQIATGRRILAPDDDPQAAQEAIRYRSSLDHVGALLNDLNVSRDWLDATAAAQGDLAKVLSDARLQGMQAANDTYSASERESIAKAVRALFGQAVSIGNSDQHGQYIFAGFQVGKQPFQADDATLTVTYGGDDGQITHEIEPGTHATVNIPGSDPAFGASFAALGDLVKALEANDGDGIRAAVSSIDTASDLVLQQQAAVGARSKTLDGAQTRLQRVQTSLNGLLSDAQDLDMAKAIVDATSYETGAQATLAVMSRILPPSLFDRLG